MHDQAARWTAISPVWFSGDFDAMLHWWQSGADPEITTFFAADKSPPAGPQHRLHQGRRAHQAALRVGSRIDQTKRADLLKQAQRRVAELIPENFPLQHVEARRGAGDAAELQGQSHQRRPILECHEWELQPAR
jgi:hypothetical protein